MSNMSWQGLNGFVPLIIGFSTNPNLVRLTIWDSHYFLTDENLFQKLYKVEGVKNTTAQCGNFRIFLSLRFYVKSKLANLCTIVHRVPKSKKRLRFLRIVWISTIKRAITLKKFREVIYLVTSLVKTLIWRKKC